MSWRHHHHFHHFGRHPHGLQRNMFFAFGGAIFATMATVWCVTWVVGGHGDHGWKREHALAQKFIGGRFAAVFADAAARRDLATAVAGELDVGVRLRDTSGAVVEAVAWPAECDESLDADVAAGRGGPKLGRVSLCMDKHRGVFRPWMTIFMLLVPASVLWGMAGAMARRIARPIRELTAVARDLGEGKLDRRVRLVHGRRGEVGELTHAVNEMAARLEKQVRDQRELLATVSHELRTPLARVRLLCEIGRDAAADKHPPGVEPHRPAGGGSEGPPVVPGVEPHRPAGGGSGGPPVVPGKDVFAGIEEEVLEMDKLVGDLLAGARLDFGVMAPRDLEVLEVAARALHRAALSRARLDAGGITAELSVHADATLLARALAALLDNAAKHGGDGAVVLRVTGDAAKVTFEVDDQGPGFPDADLPRVFDPFFQGSKGDGRGLGLGLAIVRRIAEAHGGRAFARNLPPKGARVGFSIPRKK